MELSSTQLSQSKLGCSCDKKEVKIGIGVIVRNNEDKVCGTLQINKPFINNHFTAKALALWHAIFFCKDVGFYKFILERNAS